MTQTNPLSLTMGASNSGKLIGYTVLNLDRSEYSAFALVTETDLPGTYFADGGYFAPDAGGYLVISESDGGIPILTLIAETGIDPRLTETVIADAVLTRDFSAVTGAASRSLLNALRFLRNRWFVSGLTLTVTKEDDTTPAWTALLTTDETAHPITGSDPG